MNVMARDNLIIVIGLVAVVVLVSLSIDWFYKTGKLQKDGATAITGSPAERPPLTGNPITDYVNAKFPGALR